MPKTNSVATFRSLKRTKEQEETKAITSGSDSQSSVEDTFHHSSEVEDTTSPGPMTRSRSRGELLEGQQSSNARAKTGRVPVYTSTPLLRELVQQPRRGTKASGPCSLQLTIHRLKGLDRVKYMRDCITATCVYKSKEIISEQIPKENTNYKEYFYFEWEIDEVHANNFVSNRKAALGQIAVTIKTEVDELVAKRKWTHVIGTGQLPAKQFKEAKDEGCNINFLEGTEIEQDRLEITYCVQVRIGNNIYVI